MASSLQVTNPRWLAPEILKGNVASFASDIYAFGIVLWELLSWQLPWPDVNHWQIVNLIENGGRPEIPADARLPGPDTATWPDLSAYIHLITECWAHDPEKRPTAEEVVHRLRCVWGWV